MRPVAKTWDQIRAAGVRPEAAIFRMMNTAERGRLRDGILRDGYHHSKPPTFFGDDLADGRNRASVTLELHDAGLMEDPPPCQEFEEGVDGSLMAFVARENLDLRHLSSGELAVAALEALQIYEEEAAKLLKQGRKRGGGDHSGKRPLCRIDTAERSKRALTAVENAAKDFGVKESTLQRTKRAKDKHPDLYEDIKSGRRTVGSAYKEMRNRDGSEGASLRKLKRADVDEVFKKVAADCDFRTGVGPGEFQPCNGHRARYATIQPSPDLIRDCLDVFLRKKEIHELVVYLLQLLQADEALIELVGEMAVEDAPSPTERRDIGNIIRR